MDIKFTDEKANRHQTDLLIMFCHSGNLKNLSLIGNEKFATCFSEIIKSGEFTLHKEQQLTLYNFSNEFGVNAKRIMLVSAKKTEQEIGFGGNYIERIVANTLRKVLSLNIKNVSMVLQNIEELMCSSENGTELIFQITEAIALADYEFKKYKSKQLKKVETTKTIHILQAQLKSVNENLMQSQIKRAYITSYYVKLARDWVNTPANKLTPSDMADQVIKIATDLEIDIKVMEYEHCLKMGMNAYCGVAKGSSNKAKFIHLTYKPKISKCENLKQLWLIGKGVTFDSGGISLKPPTNMWEMKGDMAGAAAVLATIFAIAELQSEIVLHAVCPMVENMPDGNAQKPGDVVKVLDGTWIEVNNTDAEGRLILADAICYAKLHKVDYLIDVATLTGAIKIALGFGSMGCFTNNNQLYDILNNAAKMVTEPITKFELDQTTLRQIRSDIADIKNSAGGGAGAITAAHFIKHFVKDTPWVHLDTASVRYSSENNGILSKGATGIPTRTLIRTVLDLSQI